MFDISFTELMLIGVVALIVIGPERLPRVARTIGHLVGRAQRYVGGVKSDIQREMDLDNLNDLKGQMEEAANTVKTSMKQAGDSLRDPLDDARKALEEASDSVDTLVKSTRDELEQPADRNDTQPQGDDTRSPATAPSDSADTSTQDDTAASSQPRHLSDAELADARLKSAASSPQTPGTPL